MPRTVEMDAGQDGPVHGSDHRPSILARRPVLTAVLVGIASLAPHAFLAPQASLARIPTRIGSSSRRAPRTDLPNRRGLRRSWPPLEA